MLMNDLGIQDRELLLLELPARAESCGVELRNDCTEESPIEQCLRAVLGVSET